MASKKYSCAPLMEIIKQELKARALTYRDVAKVLGVSENSVKLRFSVKRLSMEQTMAIAELLGLTMSELMQKLEEPPSRQIGAEQEAKLVSDAGLLLVAFRIMDSWTIEDIVANYDMTKAECVKHLLELDRMRLIDLLPNNRIRMRVTRDIDWIPEGPFQRYFRHRIDEFHKSSFNGENECRLVMHAMLTTAAVKKLQAEMRVLKQRFAELHEESLIASMDQRHQITLCLAEREWEIKEFREMRRAKGKTLPAA